MSYVCVTTTGGLYGVSLQLIMYKTNTINNVGLKVLFWLKFIKINN